MQDAYASEDAKTRILIVEDERHIARFLEYNLKKEGFAAQVAASGERALAAIEEFAPQAMLLDLLLPGISGFEVIKQVRADARHQDLVIVLLTARSFEHTPADKPAGEISDDGEIAAVGDKAAVGANAICAKPIAPSTLLKTLLELGISPQPPPAAGRSTGSRCDYGID